MKTFKGTLSIPGLGVDLPVIFAGDLTAAAEDVRDQIKEALGEQVTSSTPPITKARTVVVLQSGPSPTKPVYARSKVHETTSTENVKALVEEINSLVADKDIKLVKNQDKERVTVARLAKKAEPHEYLYSSIDESQITGAEERRVLESGIDFELPPCIVAPTEPRKVLKNGKRKKTKEVQLTNVIFKSVEDAAKKLKWSVQRVKKMLEGTGFSAAHYTNKSQQIVIKSIIVEDSQQAADIVGWKLSTVKNILGGLMKQKGTKLRYTGRYRCNYALRSKKTGLLYQNPFMAYSAEGISERSLEVEIYDKTYAI
jgi:hypothetical protein